MSSTKRTVSPNEAAAILGISKDAVRKRIKRGTLDAFKDSSGRWQINLSDDDRTDGQDKSTDKTDDKADMSGRVQALQDEITFLRKELERKDQLMAMLMQRVPQLEAPKQAGFFSKLFKKNS